MSSESDWSSTEEWSDDPPTVTHPTSSAHAIQFSESGEDSDFSDESDIATESSNDPESSEDPDGVTDDDDTALPSLQFLSQARQINKSLGLASPADTPSARTTQSLVSAPPTHSTDADYIDLGDVLGKEGDGDAPSSLRFSDTSARTYAFKPDLFGKAAPVPVPSVASLAVSAVAVTSAPAVAPSDPDDDSDWSEEADEVEAAEAVEEARSHAEPESRALHTEVPAASPPVASRQAAPCPCAHPCPCLLLALRRAQALAHAHAPRAQADLRCSNCVAAPARLLCASCGDWLCEPCRAVLHLRPARARHVSLSVDAFVAAARDPDADAALTQAVARAAASERALLQRALLGGGEGEGEVEEAEADGAANEAVVGSHPHFSAAGTAEAEEPTARDKGAREARDARRAEKEERRAARTAAREARASRDAKPKKSAAKAEKKASRARAPAAYDHHLMDADLRTAQPARARVPSSLGGVAVVAVSRREVERLQSKEERRRRRREAQAALEVDEEAVFGGPSKTAPRRRVRDAQPSDEVEETRRPRPRRPAAAHAETPLPAEPRRSRRAPPVEAGAGTSAEAALADEDLFGDAPAPRTAKRGGRGADHGADQRSAAERERRERKERKEQKTAEELAARRRKAAGGAASEALEHTGKQGDEEDVIVCKTLTGLLGSMGARTRTSIFDASDSDGDMF